MDLTPYIWIILLKAMVVVSFYMFDGSFLLFLFRCKSCNKLMTADDTEDWVYHQLDDTTHLLHGVVHANGYGHLLRVNGREGGSRILSGCHIMEFWDRLCKILGVRLGFLIVFASLISSCLLMKAIHSYMFKCV